MHAARKVAAVYCGSCALSERVSDRAAAPALMMYSCSFIEHYTNRRQILHYIEATAMCTLWRLASDWLYYPRAINLVMLHKQSENRRERGGVPAGAGGATRSTPAGYSVLSYTVACGAASRRYGISARGNIGATSPAGRACLLLRWRIEPDGQGLAVDVALSHRAEMSRRSANLCVMRDLMHAETGRRSTDPGTYRRAPFLFAIPSGTPWPAPKVITRPYS